MVHPKIQQILKPALITLLLIIGVTVRACLYLQNQSLWLDEAFITENITSKGYLELCGVLLYGQSCPIGVLWLIKLATTFHLSEYTLRLWPFIAGAVSPFILTWGIWQWSRAYAKTAMVAGLASIALPLVLYSAQVKQYSTELLVASIMLYFVLLPPKGKTEIFIYLVIFPLFTLLTYTGIFMIFSLCIFRWYNTKKFLTTLALSVPCLLSSGVIYYLQTKAFAGRPDLMQFWAHGFPPASWEALIWFPIKLVELMGFPSGLNFEWAVATIVVIGYWKLPMEQKLYIAATIFAATIAATLRIYPIEGRTALYLYPPILLCLVTGLGLIPWKAQIIVAVLITMTSTKEIIVRSVLGIRTHYTYANTALPVQEIRPLLEKLFEIKENEDIFVHPSALAQFKAYQTLLGRSDKFSIMSGTYIGWGISSIPIPTPSNAKETYLAGDCSLWKCE